MNKISLTFAALLLLPVALLAGTESDAAKQAFISMMQKKHGFDPVKLEATLNKAELKQNIIKTMNRPAEKRLTWTGYRKIFITDKRIKGGVKFWNENKALLDQAHQQFGVPPEIISAILGVETFYGGNTGGHRIIDALVTLGFHYPRRAKFFTKELENFLILTRDQNIDPTEPTGSYAGAMGKPQFMPSSYRHYAYDFDRDNKTDIWNNNADVIGSVANYFGRHGWRRDQAIATQLDGVTGQNSKDLTTAMKPSIPANRLLQNGITSKQPIRPSQLTSFIALEKDKGTEYWAGLHNFYVITRYNPRNKYAMAVYQLSEAIKQERNKQLAMK